MNLSNKYFEMYEICRGKQQQAVWYKHFDFH